MSDTAQTQEKKPFGFFRDRDGDKSSGRLIKIFSFFIAAALSTLIAFGITPPESAMVTATLVGAFLGLAGAAEITQKVTGK